MIEIVTKVKGINYLKLPFAYHDYEFQNTPQTQTSRLFLFARPSSCAIVSILLESNDVNMIKKFQAYMTAIRLALPQARPTLVWIAHYDKTTM